ALFFFSSRRRHTRCLSDWSSDVCSSDLQWSMQLGSLFQIEVTARPGHTPQEIDAALQEELDRFRTDGPTAAEVERARNTFETQKIGRASCRERVLMAVMVAALRKRVRAM